MFSRIEFGCMLAEKRREAGLTQEELIERVGDEYISISTLKRIESGQGHIEMFRVMRICKALGLELSSLIGEGNLRQVLERYFYEPGDEDEVPERLYRQQLFYPKPVDSLYYNNRPIKTLMQLLIYLPLMDDIQVLQALRNIEGDAFDRESYVLDKLSNLFDQIPYSKAKRYADYAAAKCTYDYFVEYYSNDITEADKIWLDPVRREEMLSWHDEYVRIIEEKKEMAEAVRVLQK